MTGNRVSDDEFATLSRSVYERLDNIISRLAPDATTWQQFKLATEASPSLVGGDDDADDLFDISLKLALQPGVTWKEKWSHVQLRSPPPPSRHPRLERRLQRIDSARREEDPPPRELEAKAVQFRTLHLLASHFDPWRSLTRFKLERERSIELARHNWLARCALQDWKARLERRSRKLQHLELVLDEATSAASYRKVKSTWDQWIRMSTERQRLRLRQERELELRSARNQVIHNSNIRLLATSFTVSPPVPISSLRRLDPDAYDLPAARRRQVWKLATLERFAVKFRLRYLPLARFRTWRLALDRRRDKQDLLESIERSVVVSRTKLRFFRPWSKQTTLLRLERDVRNRSTAATKTSVMQLWIEKTCVVLPMLLCLFGTLWPKIYFASAP